MKTNTDTVYYIPFILWNFEKVDNKKPLPKVEDVLTIVGMDFSVVSIEYPRFKRENTKVRLFPKAIMAMTNKMVAEEKKDIKEISKFFVDIQQKLCDDGWKKKSSIGALEISPACIGG